MQTRQVVDVRHEVQLAEQLAQIPPSATVPVGQIVIQKSIKRAIVMV